MIAAGRGRVALERRTLVVPAKDVLHVYRRDGTHTIRGKNIDVVYQRLLPYLRGSHDEEQLLDSVDTRHANTVQLLLRSLRTAGAIAFEYDDAGQRPIRTVLDDSEWAWPDEDGPMLAFVSPARAAEWLLALKNDDSLRHWTCLVLTRDTGDDTAAARERKAGYARWLLASVFDAAPPQPELWIFRLSDQDGSLTRLAHVRPASDEASLSTLADQLRLVRGADVDQLPLVVGTASSELFPTAITAYGLRFQDVRTFVCAHALVASRTDTNTDLLIADSRPAVEALALEREAAERCHADHLWEEVDALSIGGDHPNIAYLQQMLRLRRSTFPVLRATSPLGVVFVRSMVGELSAVSLVPEKALCEFLLKAVWKEFYASSELVAWSVPVCQHSSFTRPEDLERRVRAYRRLRAEDDARPGVVTRRLVWGLEAWCAEWRPAAEAMC